MKQKSLLFFGICLLTVHTSFGQLLTEKESFSHADSIRGSVTPERAWWNVLYYTIKITPDYSKKKLTGENTIQWQSLKPGQVLQVDLQEPMKITAVTYHHKRLTWQRNGNAFYVKLPRPVQQGKTDELTINYEGIPHEAANAPWDGGWVWSKDEKGRPWMSVACQGLGASSWFPCKDHLSDEPDHGASLSITVPDSLVAVANGRLAEKKTAGIGLTTYVWKVINPINSYDIAPYIGKYVSWKKEFAGLKGELDCNFWVLDYNLKKGKEHFGIVDTALHADEYWMGPYPFYEDGYQLVEAPYSGMEHQSAIAYGNRFENGWTGEDVTSNAFYAKWFGLPLPKRTKLTEGTGWGLKWDFVIVHESSHEWFGNSITVKDLGDMWIHEAFAVYSEVLYTAYKYGIEAGNDYCIGYRTGIGNAEPLIGPYNVNKEGSIDMYMKGANMIHMIRQVVGDAKFRELLQTLNTAFYHQTVTSAQFEALISATTHQDFSVFFDQYLRTTLIPVLEYKIDGQNIQYRWTNCVKGFRMPIKVYLADQPEQWITPTESWQSLGATNNQGDGDSNTYSWANPVEGYPMPAKVCWADQSEQWNTPVESRQSLKSSSSLEPLTSLDGPADSNQIMIGATGNQEAGDINISVDRNFYVMLKRVK